MTTDEILNKETFSFLSIAERERVKIAMRTFAKEKCKEQRELCAEHEANSIISNYIRNTRLPEMK